MAPKNEKTLCKVVCVAKVWNWKAKRYLYAKDYGKECFVLKFWKRRK